MYKKNRKNPGIPGLFLDAKIVNSLKNQYNDKKFF